MHGYYICHVLTYSGNEIILTLHKTQDSPSDNSFNCELIGMTWNNGDGKGIDVSHIWDGEHRESSTWFYFDDEGNLVTL